MNKSALILGIESSCDDTGIAVVEARADLSYSILSNCIASQDHRATQGVVPEVAARHHASNIHDTISKALSEAGVSMADIDAIAVTTTPGLIACLQVGIEAAKALALSHNTPLIGVHHMKAHIASTFAEHPNIAFPAIVLLASGGHTMIVRMTGERGREQYEILGQTRDDAAGEAFDKIAVMLGLNYPGGPEIARLAAEGGEGSQGGRGGASGNPKAFDFPRPMLHGDESTAYEFSFAGLKTAVLYTIRDLGGIAALSAQQKADVAASAQAAIVEVLVRKTVKAAKEYDAKTVIIGGGVSANVELRETMQSMLEVTAPNATLIVPSPGLFTDNGAMIAIAASAQALQGEWSDPFALRAVARTPISE